MVNNDPGRRRNGRSSGMEGEGEREGEAGGREGAGMEEEGED